MKIRFIFYLFISAGIFISCSNEPVFDGKFSFSPVKPEPGEEITVRYVPDSTDITEGTPVELAAYYYDHDLIDAVSVEMEKKQDGWYGKFIPPDNTYGVIIKFLRGDKSDNNQSAGYLINIYEGGELIPGSNAGYAAAGMRWGINVLELEMEGSEALRLFNEELKVHPELKSEFISPYLGALLKTYQGRTDSIITDELAVLEKKKKMSENELQYLVSRFKIPPFTDSIKADKYFEMLAAEYPENELIENEDYKNVYEEKNFTVKLSLLKEFEKKHPGSESAPYLYFSAGSRLVEEKNIDSVVSFGKKYQFKVHPAFFNRSVNKLVDQDEADIGKLLTLSKMGLEASRRQIENPFVPKRKYETTKEFEKSNNYYLALNLYTNALLLDKLAQHEEAAKLLEEAVGKSDHSDPFINNLFIKNLFKLKKYSIVRETIEKYIAEGKATPEMKEVLKQVFIINNGNESDYISYLGEFEDKARAHLIEKLKKEMISESAPDFNLKDLSGKNVSLSSLKSKIVIIDFWATWCGPCINSFPAMQQSVNNFREDGNVQFLFINTWERSEDKLKNAADFIKQNNYKFRVLIDQNDKVVENYKVSGIPTKFIIDKAGQIRFKSVGYSGNNEQLIEELDAMISLLK